MTFGPELSTRNSVIREDKHWGPDTADIAVEMLWDKIRLDAHTSLASLGRNISNVDLFDVTHEAAQAHGVNWDSPEKYLDINGQLLGMGMIINYVYNELVELFGKEQ